MESPARLLKYWWHLLLFVSINEQDFRLTVWWIWRDHLQEIIYFTLWSISLMLILRKSLFHVEYVSLQASYLEERPRSSRLWFKVEEWSAFNGNTVEKCLTLIGTSTFGDDSRAGQWTQPPPERKVVSECDVGKDFGIYLQDIYIYTRLVQLNIWTLLKYNPKWKLLN